MLANDQSVNLSNNSNESVKKNTMDVTKICQNQNAINSYNKISKLLLLAISGRSVNTLSYNCNIKNNQLVAINCLSRWLEWRHSVVISSIYSMFGLKCKQMYEQCSDTEINSYSSRNSNNKDLLMDYKSYTTAIGEDESYGKINIGRSSRLNSNQTKSIYNIDDKKKKSHKKDIHDSFIEKLVRNNKQQRQMGKIPILRSMYKIKE